MLQDPDAFWEEMLSSDPARIRKAWMDLTDEESQSVLDHLRRMCAEPGFQPEQQKSAAAALDVIQSLAD